MNKLEEILKNSQKFSDDIINILLEDDQIRWAIYRDVEYEYHLEDVMSAIKEYNEENDTNYTFTNDELKLMVEDYEDRLGDCEDWRDKLYSVLREWVDDRG